MKKNTPNLPLIYFVSLIVPLFYLCTLSVITQSKFLHLIYYLIETIYIPNVNKFSASTVFGLTIMQHCYISIGLTLIITFIVKLITSVFNHTKNSCRINYQEMISVIIIHFILLTTLQLLGQAQFYQQLKKRYSHQEYADRYTSGFLYIKKFSKICQRLLPENCSAQLITGLDLNKERGMYIHRALSYFLYPIDIRSVRRQPPQCLIVFQKENPMESVPEDYRVLALIDKNGLLAVKK